MKGLSVLVTIVLLVLAHQLACRLQRLGALPAENRPRPQLTRLHPANRTEPGHRLRSSGQDDPSYLLEKLANPLI